MAGVVAEAAVAVAPTMAILRAITAPVATAGEKTATRKTTTVRTKARTTAKIRPKGTVKVQARTRVSREAALEETIAPATARATTGAHRATDVQITRSRSGLNAIPQLSTTYIPSCRFP